MIYVICVVARQCMRWLAKNLYACRSNWTYDRTALWPDRYATHGQGGSIHPGRLDDFTQNESLRPQWSLNLLDCQCLNWAARRIHSKMCSSYFRTFAGDAAFRNTLNIGPAYEPFPTLIDSFKFKFMCNILPNKSVVNIVWQSDTTTSEPGVSRPRNVSLSLKVRKLLWQQVYVARRTRWQNGLRWTKNCDKKCKTNMKN